MAVDGLAYPPMFLEMINDALIPFFLRFAWFVLKFPVLVMIVPRYDQRFLGCAALV